MKKTSTVIVGAAAVAVLLVGSAAAVAATGISWCVTDPTTGLCSSPIAPGDPTGVPTDYVQYNWNNVSGPEGVYPNLVHDLNGVAVPTNATVLWSSTNTWASTGMGEENNNFIGVDRQLMTGYLDQNTFTPSPTFVQITNIPDDVAANYDIVIYTLGGQPNRGGEYAVNGGAPKFVVASGDGSFNGPDFVEAIADDPAYGTRDWGNYVVFRGLSGNTVTITATNSLGGKAPVNGVQIVNATP
jgi:hypothetical protein